MSSTGTHSALLARTVGLQRRADALCRQQLDAVTTSQLKGVQLALRNIDTWLGVTLIASESSVFRAIEERLATEARLLDALGPVCGAGGPGGALVVAGSTVGVTDCADFSAPADGPASPA